MKLLIPDLFALMNSEHFSKRSQYLEFSNTGEITQLSQAPVANDKKLFNVFLKGSGNQPGLSSRIRNVLQEANINTPPGKLFETINGFTVLITPQQAKSLLQDPAIRSVESDQPFPLTPPIEAEAEAIPETNSFGVDKLNTKVLEKPNRPKEIDSTISLDNYFIEDNTNLNPKRKT